MLNEASDLPEDPARLYDTATGRLVAMLLRTGKTPSGAGAAGHIRVALASVCPDAATFKAVATNLRPAPT